MKVIIKSEDACILRSFLKETLHLSSRTVSLLKTRKDGILLNGIPVTVRAMLKEGDVLSLALADDKSNDNLVPTPLPLSVLYEDEALILCNKEAGMPTHPSHGHYEDTLANALAHRYLGTPFIFRAVTRLDRETSGVVLVAKDAHSAHLLSDQMQTIGLQKSYFTLVHGITPPSGTIDLPIRRAKESALLREVHADGAPSVTHYRRLFCTDAYSLLAVFPQTGRTHQIRLHLSASGFPICGDTLYGREHDGFPRTLLHASRLAFLHPYTRLPLSVFAPLPEDFRSALAVLSLPLPSEQDAISQEARGTALPHDLGQQR